MKELSKLFGSEARVKLMRLFLLNSGDIMDSQDLAARLRVARPRVATEAKQLQAIGFLKKKSFYKDILRHGKKAKKRSDGWYLNSEFIYNDSLKALLVDEEILNKQELVKRFRRGGKLKLFVVSGFFMKEKTPDGRVDILIVGDNLRKPWLEDSIRKLESEIGKELTYAIFDTQEYIYRFEMYDKLVRDILDFPHEKLVANQALLTLSTQDLKKA